MQATRNERTAIARVLTAARLAIGLSQQTWSDMLGVHESTVQRWEAGVVAPTQQTRLFVMELLRRGDLRAKLHEKPTVELALIGAGLLPRLEWTLESTAHQVLLLAGYDGLTPNNRAEFDRVLATARDLIAAHHQVA